ncbi:CS domain-containing protein [Paenibacillus assamensis]|uniref:CS domain-containing protein n=1 Tax=Paenibacillus assamensis TaxID=311244 RepID=UPI00040F6569|nr:CS domain-containing protein [Paenibacillus assamensis]
MANMSSFFPWQKFQEQFGITMPINPSQLLTQTAIQKYVEEEIKRSFSKAFDQAEYTSDTTDPPPSTSPATSGKPGWSSRETDHEITIEVKMSKKTKPQDVRLQMNPSQLLIQNTSTSRKQLIPLSAPVFPKSTRATIQDNKLRIVMRKQVAGNMQNIDIQIID